MILMHRGWRYTSEKDVISNYQRGAHAARNRFGEEPVEACGIGSEKVLLEIHTRSLMLMMEVERADSIASMGTSERT